MKPNLHAPGERDLSLLTGIGLILLSGMILLIWHFTGGNPRQFPALLARGFLFCGALIVLTTLHRRRTRRR